MYCCGVIRSAENGGIVSRSGTGSQQVFPKGSGANRTVGHLGMRKRKLITEVADTASAKEGRCSACNRMFIAKGDHHGDVNKQFEAHHCDPDEEDTEAPAPVVKRPTENKSQFDSGSMN